MECIRFSSLCAAILATLRFATMCVKRAFDRIHYRSFVEHIYSIFSLHILYLGSAMKNGAVEQQIYGKIG